MPSPVKNCIKPGEVRNPKGNNQYTYRRDFEKWFAEECKIRGRAGIKRLFDQWEKGERHAQQAVMDRAMPAVQKHEVLVPGVGFDQIEAAIDRFQSSHETQVPVKPNGNGAA